MYTIIKVTYQENNYNFKSNKKLIPELFGSEEEAEEKIHSMIQGEMVKEKYEKTFTDYMDDNFHVFAEYRIMRLENC